MLDLTISEQNVVLEPSYQLCLDSDSLVEILDLCDQSICNAVLTTEELNEPKIRYHLKLFVCEKYYFIKRELFRKTYEVVYASFLDIINKIIKWVEKKK